MLFANARMPRAEQAASFVGTDHLAPMVMVDLLKFKPLAEYPHGRHAGMTGREAYGIYGAAVQYCLGQVGGRVVYSGDVTGLLIGQIDALWDMVALPDYRGIEVHRFAGLAGQLNIRTAPGIMP